ncbi:MAG TPA: hypothetical protein DEO62_01330, partial [Lachnospiraceae bacterium]|nr:hypothetical protein [Lachnospiraceae bacterium]HBZ89651.1 hypothetical protein [Lachnospiraceae bacterium]
GNGVTTAGGNGTGTDSAVNVTTVPAGDNNAGGTDENPTTAGTGDGGNTAGATDSADGNQSDAGNSSNQGNGSDLESGNPASGGDDAEGSDTGSENTEEVTTASTTTTVEVTTTTETTTTTTTTTTTQDFSSIDSENVVDYLKTYDHDSLSLPRKVDSYTAVVDSWPTIIDGKDCLCVNLYRDGSELVGMVYVAKDGSAVYYTDEFGDHIKVN